MFAAFSPSPLSAKLKMIVKARLDPFLPGQRHDLKLAFTHARAKYPETLPLRLIPITRLPSGHVIIDLSNFAPDLLLVRRFAVVYPLIVVTPHRVFSLSLLARRIASSPEQIGQNCAAPFQR